MHDLRALAGPDLPLGLAQLHHSLQPNDRVDLIVDPTTLVDAPPLDEVLEGGGFVAGRPSESQPGGGLRIPATRMWTLPDTVGSGLTMIMCGLNPSPAAADAGVGFAGPSNRFWPAAVDAGLVSIPRDALAAFDHGIGMTDLVKRTTRRANELTPQEYAHGVTRVERLCRWLQPGALCLVGLSGWRAAMDRKARAGWQPTSLGPTPVYLMPSTSGLNAHETVASLRAHLERAAAGPPLPT